MGTQAWSSPRHPCRSLPWSRHAAALPVACVLVLHATSASLAPDTISSGFAAAVVSVPTAMQGSRPAWHPPSCVAAVHGEGGPWPALVQEVDLVGELGRRGVGPAAACAFLDTSPPIALQASGMPWC
jgi:hypothetical protein